ASQSTHFDIYKISAFDFPLYWHIERLKDTTCTACENCSLYIGINVKEDISLDAGHVDVIGSAHTDFLIHSKDGFQRRMRNIIAVQKSQRVCHGDTVVSAQCRVLCFNKSI